MSCSGCTEGDMVTNLNMVFWGLKSPSMGNLYHPFAAYGPSADYLRMFVTKNVTQWLFGYTDPVITGLHAKYPCCSGFPICVACTPSTFNGLIGPNQAVFDPTQAADTLFVGSKPDQQLIRAYDRYENLQYLVTQSFNPAGSGSISAAPTWASSAANRIAGTDGTQFPPGIQDGQTINIYVNQLRRVVTLGNQNNQHVTFKGLDLVHFTLPPVFLYNCSGNIGACDFYSYGYNGVANLTATGNPDFYVSKPHFLDSDPDPTLAMMNWLGATTAPTKDVYDTFLEVEPISGATMNAAKRLQLSVRMTPITTGYLNATGSLLFEQYGPLLPNGGLYMPVFWAEEGASISDSDASSFKSQVYGAQKASVGIAIAGEALGAAFAVLTVVLFWMAATKAGPGGTTDNKGLPLS